MPRELTEILETLAALTRRRFEPEDLKSIGRRLGLSPWHAQRILTQHVGESPKQYQLRLQVEAAAAQLLSTPARIIDIAFAVGFETHEGFTRSFTRRFGHTPSEYRARFKGNAGADFCPQLVHSVGPCVGLYGKSLDPSLKEPIMSYDITIQETNEVPVLFVRRRCDWDKLAEVLSEVLPATYQYALTHGLGMSGPPYLQIVEQSAAFVQIRAGVPLTQARTVIEQDAPVETGVLPGGRAATTIHTGEYQELSQAQAAMERWIDAQGLEVRAPMWFVYLTDPAEVPDPKQWQTQVVCPVE